MKFLALAAALAFNPPVASAPVPVATMAVDANQILKEVDKRAAAFKTQKYDAEMEILKGGVTKKTLQFEMMMKGLTKQLITFTAPGDVAGMKVLMQDPTTLYVFLPEFKKVRRVAAHAMNQGFLGGEFTYEDMTQIELAPFFDAELGGKDGNETTLVLKVKEDVTSTYPKIEVVIDASKGGVTRLRYYDKADKLVREQHRDEWVKVDGKNVPTKVSMLDLKSGDMTVITLSDIEVNQEIDDSVFSRRELLRG